MRCPRCGKGSRVLETRGYQRKRQCPLGHRYWTDEVVIESIADAQDLRDWAALKAKAKLLLGEAKKPKAVARDLNLGIQTIYRWRKSWQSGA
jgi:transposase-like protein